MDCQTLLNTKFRNVTLCNCHAIAFVFLLKRWNYTSVHRITFSHSQCNPTIHHFTIRQKKMQVLNAFATSASLCLQPGFTKRQLNFFFVKGIPNNAIVDNSETNDDPADREGAHTAWLTHLP